MSKDLKWNNLEHSGTLKFPWSSLDDFVECGLNCQEPKPLSHFSGLDLPQHAECARTPGGAADGTGIRSCTATGGAGPKGVG